MLSAKHQLHTALAAELDKLQPGAGARAAFESPKVAAHGDLACTAAMQLAKALKQTPRQLGEALREAPVSYTPLTPPTTIMVYNHGGTTEAQKKTKVSHSNQTSVGKI